MIWKNSTFSMYRNSFFSNSNIYCLNNTIGWMILVYQELSKEIQEKKNSFNFQFSSLQRRINCSQKRWMKIGINSSSFLVVIILWTGSSFNSRKLRNTIWFSLSSTHVETQIWFGQSNTSQKLLFEKLLTRPLQLKENHFKLPGAILLA